MNLKTKCVRKKLFIIIKQCLTCFFKYILKVGRETVGCNSVKIGVFLCRTMNTVAFLVFFFISEKAFAGRHISRHLLGSERL